MAVDKTAAKKNKRLPKLDLIGADRSRHEVLSPVLQEHFLGSDRTISILEAGCGRRWDIDLGDVEYSLTGMDISKEALELRNANEGDLDRTIVGDLQTAVLDSDEFDVVYCVNVIEHINGAERVVSNLFNWLKPGGLLILAFPNRDSAFGFATRFSPHWAHVAVYKHIYRYPHAGEPGYNPFPTYYDKIVSRRGIHDYCNAHGHRIVMERGKPHDSGRMRMLAPAANAMFNVLHYLSFGAIAVDHGGLVFVIEKDGEARRTMSSAGSTLPAHTPTSLPNEVCNVLQ